MRRVAALFAALSLCSSPALANGRFPLSNQIAKSSALPSSLVVRTSFGLLTSNDGGKSFSWICEGVMGYGGTQDPGIALFDDGSMAVAAFEGLSVSHDGGCTWTRIADDGLADQYVIDVAAERDLPARGVAITSTGLAPAKFYVLQMRCMRTLRSVLAASALSASLAAACGANDSKVAPLADPDAIDTEPGTSSSRPTKASMSPLPRAEWGRDKCASKKPEGTGAGQRVREMVLKTCDGKEVSLDDYCGAAGIWLFIAHGWCPNCKKTAGYTDQIAKDYESKGLVVVNLLGQDAAYQTPSTDFCEAWRDKYGLSNAVVLFDSYGDQAKSFENGATPIQVFIDVDHNIASRTNTSTEKVIRSQIDATLARIP